MNGQEFIALLVLATAASFTPGPNTMLSTSLAANFGFPPRQNTCRLYRTKNPVAAKKDKSGTIRTNIQGTGGSSVIAA